MTDYKVTFHFHQMPQSDKHTFYIEAASEKDAIKQAKTKLEHDFPYEFTQPYNARCEVC